MTTITLKMWDEFNEINVERTIDGSNMLVNNSKAKLGWESHVVGTNKQIEYTTETPVIIKYSEIPSNALINNFALDNLNDWYLFKIPKGSISNNYSLDAK